MQTSERVDGRGGWFGRRGARPGGLLVRLGLSAVACVVIASAAASCSLIVQTDSDQCANVSACSTFPGLRSCTQNVCVAVASPGLCTMDADCSMYASAACQGGTCVRTCMADTDCGGTTKCANGTCGGATECKVNKDCMSKGTHYICRKDTFKCAALLSAECKTIAGDDQNDEAFIFGSVLPTLGLDGSAGAPVEASIQLAMSDILKTSGGIPVANGVRPLVLVGCNDSDTINGSNADVALKAAQHLVNDVGVPVIVGHTFSGVTIELATKLTINAGVMLFSPAATSVAITDLKDNNLVWRTSPPDSLQAKALALYIQNDLEPRIRKDLGLLPGDFVNLAIYNNSNTYGDGLATGIENVLQLNGKAATDASNKSHYFRLSYGDPDNMADPEHAPDAVANAAMLKPHIVLVFGYNEGVTDVAFAIESSPWVKNGTYKPNYVFSDGGFVSDLWDGINKLTDKTAAADLRKRVSGSTPGTDNTLFQAYKAKYNSSQFKTIPAPDTLGAAGAYDITYLLAYGVASLGTKPITGANLAASMSKMVPSATAVQCTPGSPKCDVGTLNLNKAFTVLESPSGAIDFNGASGPLNFDLKTGEAPSDIQIWCVPSGTAPDVAGSALNSGIFYDVSTTPTMPKLVGVPADLHFDPTYCN